ncbi:hypothetical protein KAR48_13055 [bacterium]|nr:hypothetical protein [bacterium]
MLDKEKDFDEFSRAELEQFIKEKEQIRKIVGQIGGKPTTLGKIFEIVMITLVLATLIAAPFLPHHLELPAVELGLVLLSIKIFIFLRNEAKVIHFQFWMLSSLEWRMNDMAKRLSSMDKNLEIITKKVRPE